MSDRIWVATRKGLFAVDRSKAGNWTVGPPSFLGNPVTFVLPDRRGDGTLYAALNLGHFGIKLQRSTDDGASWDEITAPRFAPVDDSAGADEEAVKAAPSVSLIWSLESGGDDRPERLWLGTIPGALFRSDDAGASWQLVESLWNRPERAQWFGGGYDDPGIHSICVDPRNSDALGVAVSCGGYWVTSDAGANWECRASGMYAEYMPPEKREDPGIQDPHLVVRCPGDPDHLWTQHHNGVFRSTDDGRHWEEVTAIKPAKFGFAVATHPRHPGTAWFVPGVKDECRVPVDGEFVVARTRDGGASFEVLKEGLPPAPAYDLVFRHALAVDDSGERLAMGSTTGGLWISENAGDSWSCVSAHLPPVYAVRFA